MEKHSGSAVIVAIAEAVSKKVVEEMLADAEDYNSALHHASQMFQCVMFATRRFVDRVQMVFGDVTGREFVTTGTTFPQIYNEFIQVLTEEEGNPVLDCTSKEDIEKGIIMYIDYCIKYQKQLHSICSRYPEIKTSLELEITGSEYKFSGN
jgi:hypothetical protein